MKEESRPSAQRNEIAIIYQNFYKDEQAASLDPAFVPNDGRRNANAHYREVGLFLRKYHAGAHRKAPYTGIVSPKFGEKTGRRGSEFIQFIAENPGHDVYFINPFPEHTYYCFNVWAHAELCHPGLTALAHNLFCAAEIDFDVRKMGRNTPATALYSNFWVGNEIFWDRFMHLNLRLLSALERMTEREQKPYFEIDTEYAEPVPFLTFIFERLFSTYVLMDPTVRALAWPYSRSELLAQAGSSLERFRIISAFKSLIDEIDTRAVYDDRDRAIFAALSRMVADDSFPRANTFLG